MSLTEVMRGKLFSGMILGLSTEQLLKTSGVERYIIRELLYRIGGLKNREIGVIFGVDYSTVSQGRKRLRQHKQYDENLQSLFQKMNSYYYLIVKNKDLTPSFTSFIL